MNTVEPWRFSRDGSRRRRGHDAEIPWRRVEIPAAFGSADRARRQVAAAVADVKAEAKRRIAKAQDKLREVQEFARKRDEAARKGDGHAAAAAANDARAAAAEAKVRHVQGLLKKSHAATRARADELDAWKRTAEKAAERADPGGRRTSRCLRDARALCAASRRRRGRRRGYSAEAESAATPRPLTWISVRPARPSGRFPRRRGRARRARDGRGRQRRGRRGGRAALVGGGR